MEIGSGKIKCICCHNWERKKWTWMKNIIIDININYENIKNYTKDKMLGIKYQFYSTIKSEAISISYSCLIRG